MQQRRRRGRGSAEHQVPQALQSGRAVAAAAAHVAEEECQRLVGAAHGPPAREQQRRLDTARAGPRDDVEEVCETRGGARGTPPPRSLQASRRTSAAPARSPSAARAPPSMERTHTLRPVLAAVRAAPVAADR